MRGSVRYHIRHETAYAYASDVVHSHQLLHLVPRPTAYQQCLEHAINVTPASYRRRNEIDTFGNLVTRVEFDHPHRRFEVATDMEVEVHPRPAINAADSLPWERAAAELAYRGLDPARDSLEAARFKHESPYVRIKTVFNEYAAVVCFRLLRDGHPPDLGEAVFYPDAVDIDPLSGAGQSRRILPNEFLAKMEFIVFAES